jgi:hypothetical protein
MDRAKGPCTFMSWVEMEGSVGVVCYEGRNATKSRPQAHYTTCISRIPDGAGAIIAVSQRADPGRDRGCGSSA